MSWKQVAIAFILVGGALVAVTLKAENLASMLAGAAAGFIAQKQEKDREGAQ